MTDLDTAAAEMNAVLADKGIKLVWCTAGKKSLKFWKKSYAWETGGYGISKDVARQYGVPV